MKIKRWFPFNLIGISISFVLDVVHLFWKNVSKSIRLQLILTFVACFLISLFIYSISSSILREYYSIFPLIIALACFIILFYFLTQRKMTYIEELAGGLREISKGNLHYRVVNRSRDELGSLALHINHMTEELQTTIEEERNAEKTKNELITNVSHDLRTPLTSIIGYLRLLKDKNYENEQQAENYLNVAYNKSEKLKSLLENLFEFTKLSHSGVELQLEKVCINELLEQLLEEFVTYAEENQLKLVKMFPADKLMVPIDADKIIRVFENLLTNAVKYSLKPGEIKVMMWEDDENVKICMVNKSEAFRGEELARIFDRFYRAETSRSTETGGSGLGLAIAKSIVNLHGGDIWVENEKNEIRFWVKLKLA